MSGERLSLRSLYHLVRTVIPAHCAVCQRLAPAGICESCFASRLHLILRWCRRCGKPLVSQLAGWEGGCGNCAGRGYANLSGVRSLFAYTEAAREILHGAKFGGRARLLAELVELAWGRYGGRENPAFLLGIDPLELDFLVSVPLSMGRYFMRGANQAEVVASTLARLSGISLLSRLVEKARNTPSQSGLSRRQREQNVRGAFRVNRRLAERVRGRNVLVVDDLITTGATVQELAKVLKKSGVGQVFAFSLFTTDPRFG